MIVAGGGALNHALVNALRQATGTPLCTSDDLSVPAPARESLAMAVLAALSADGVPITAHTGRAQPPLASGSWTLPDGLSSRWHHGIVASWHHGIKGGCYEDTMP